MQNTDFDKIIKQLGSTKEYEFLYHRTFHEIPMPSIAELNEVVSLLRGVLFPGYFGNSDVRPESLNYYIGANIDKIYKLLSEQIKRGFCFLCEKDENACLNCENKSKEIAKEFISRLPKIKHLLSTDVIAAFNGDPAAKTYGEAIFCYPSIHAVTNYRIGHELVLLDVPLIPRIITEMSHSETGIDIHPGATIDEFFFIDHGTGVVIGETTIIGKNVRIYQGVTLGAKSFPVDEKGNPMKGVPRHPVVEDDVIIYSNATLLGRITIGKGSVIGGNMWITKDVAPGTKVMQNKQE
ncbi:MAG: serine acetyltransferase [Bacteroidales bacterium]|nr:serine acetyltransferase [Bacteroidales bacterium]